MLLLIAVVLDPRNKLVYINWCIDNSFDSQKPKELKDKLDSTLGSLHNEYEGVGECSGSYDATSQMNENDDDDFYCEKLFLQATGRRVNAKSELEKYIKEECEIASNDFDLLTWWKINSTRFPVLASIAREVLAIPVSTVASQLLVQEEGYWILIVVP
jgi:hypothetical protein